MSIVPTPEVYNNIKYIVILKSMILDPGQFDSDQTKFKDQWRRIQLFLKSNRVIATDNKITVILAQLRRSVAGIYAQKKINQIEEENKVQDQNNFVIEIKTVFGDKSQTADTE